ncbi:MAG TPA: hypothetical protein DCK99_15535 [Blastocatellia bacterium]|nr:hypothetical protein [Blastocatellia bacterium]
MKTRSLQPPALKTDLTVLCVSLILLAAVCNPPVFSQTREPTVSPCKVGVRAPAFGFWTWAANSQVKVFILAAHFKTEEIPVLLAPLESWNAVAEASSSGVKFTYAGSVSEPQYCENCLTIMRGKVYEKKTRHATKLQAYSVHADQIISYAEVVIDPIITNPEALKNAVVHELGHNFGLLDCFSCKDRSTVMNQFKVINVSNGMEAPTACDISQVKAAYEELKTHVRPSPMVAKVMVDEGEEPVDDDTPTVIPLP